MVINIEGTFFAVLFRQLINAVMMLLITCLPITNIIHIHDNSNESQLNKY